MHTQLQPLVKGAALAGFPTASSLRHHKWPLDCSLYHSLISCSYYIIKMVRKPSAVPMASQPNILFIMADDHAAKAISAYGAGINKTPHIDRLAQEGMLFNHCYVTNSICTPSRAAILTGLKSTHPARLGRGSCPHRNAQPCQCRPNVGQQIRQVVAKRSQASEVCWLPDRDDWQVAFG